MSKNSGTMYRWRQWTEQQRHAILLERQQRNHPYHSPAHISSDYTSLYMLTAACYEHRAIIGASEQRLTDFSIELCGTIQPLVRSLFAWVVLPNHYHFLADVPDLRFLIKSLGTLHGRTSFHWNGEDILRGRKVWYNAAETAMKSEGHFYATLNYVLHNPVHHGYCAKWTEWPFSSAAEYLNDLGHEKAANLWRSYPIYDYGKSWDPPEL